MGKISDALAKAGREDAGTTVTHPKPQVAERQNVSPSSEKPASLQPSQPSPPPQEKWEERLWQAVNVDQNIPEVFKVLRSRVLHPESEEKVPRTIMITSAMPKEGKSFVTANLGISLAQGMDQYSLMINCDLRRPTLSTLFGMPGEFGLVDYLRDHMEIEKLILKTSVDKLSILASGKTPVNPAELLSSSRMKELIEELAKRYDDRFILFDCPPFQLAAESTALAHLVDKVVVVVRQNRSSKHQVKKLVETLGREKILGIVFNDHTVNVLEKSLVKGYGYSYGYGS